MPTDTELLASVRDFLREDIAEETQGRKKFLNLVASNSLDILVRENTLRKPSEHRELTGLRTLLGKDGELDDLRQELVALIRHDHFVLEDLSLQEHLSNTVANRVLVDQPSYAGLKTAQRNGPIP